MAEANDPLARVKAKAAFNYKKRLEDQKRDQEFEQSLKQSPAPAPDKKK